MELHRLEGTENVKFIADFVSYVLLYLHYYIAALAFSIQNYV